METCLKTGFAQISLAAQKIWVAQNLGRGGLQPPRPPGPYAYVPAFTDSSFQRFPVPPWFPFLPLPVFCFKDSRVERLFQHNTVVHQQTLRLRIPWQFLKNNILFVLAASIACVSCVQASSISWRLHAGNSIQGIYPFDSRNQKWLKMGVSSCLLKIAGLAFNVSAFST